MLKELNLKNCKALQLLPELPMRSVSLELSKCRSLEMIINLPNLLKSLALVTDECDKLTEVQRLFKLEPIGNFDEVMIRNLGLSDLEFLRSIEVYLFNNMTRTIRKVPIQGLCEFGIFSTFLPGSEVPGWFSIKSLGSSICFKVPSFPNFKFQRSNVCVVYALSNRDYDDSHDPITECWNEFHIKVSNRTKDLKWTYSPTFLGVPDEGEDMVWLSHWNFGNVLEAGDEVDVSVFVDRFLWHCFKPKKFGIHVVFGEEEKGTYPSCQNVNNRVLYQAKTGWYHLLFGDSEGVAPLPPMNGNSDCRG
ncbi:uncharacterized protein LOC132301404 [Cornus florida]|uniref:uncharacterized protein LOC132301404 n=1 Tax=Cornus florida TaxID=4283 RepID=UPI0028966685|nr:uncharacterized protein LOC132301404 [Cornus florida]